MTVSDSVALGRHSDESGPAAARMLGEAGAEVIAQTVVPDERHQIADELRRLAGEGAVLVVTAGGTGVGPRDVTPEATQDACSRMVPGLGEAMRRASLEKTPYAVISRATAGILDESLVLNLPGSPRAVEECLEAVTGVLPHALGLITGRPTSHRPD